MDPEFLRHEKRIQATDIFRKYGLRHRQGELTDRLPGIFLLPSGLRAPPNIRNLDDFFTQKHVND